MTLATPPRWEDLTALFGGTFDPPHLGHREAVRGLFTFPKVQRVWVIPSANPPHKPTLASTEHRVSLVRLAFGPSTTYPLSGEVQIDLREIERARQNPGKPTYTIDTLAEIRKVLGKPPAFALGIDQLVQLPTWHRFPEVLEHCHWIVLTRRSETSRRLDDVAYEALKVWESSGLVRATRTEKLWQIRQTQASDSRGPTFLTLAPTQAPALSSTWIREELARSGTPPDGALLPEVLAYLKQHALYDTGRDSKR